MKPVFEIGDTVQIQCEVNPDPFLGEHLISFETIKGTISGFVRSSELTQERDKTWLIRAMIKHVYSDRVDVMVNGSFFTTNGLATLSLDTAVATTHDSLTAGNS